MSPSGNSVLVDVLRDSGAAVLQLLTTVVSATSFRVLRWSQVAHARWSAAARFALSVTQRHSAIALCLPQLPGNMTRLQVTTLRLPTNIPGFIGTENHLQARGPGDAMEEVLVQCAGG